MKKILTLLGETFAKRYAEEHSVRVSVFGGSAETNYRRWRLRFNLYSAIKISIALMIVLFFTWQEHKEDVVLQSLFVIAIICFLICAISWIVLETRFISIETEKSKKLYHGWAWRRDVLKRVEGLKGYASKLEIQTVISSRLKQLSGDLTNLDEKYKLNSPHWEIIEEIRELKQVAVDCELAVPSLETLLGVYHNARRKFRTVPK